jgi:hypothetical protein
MKEDEHEDNYHKGYNEPHIARYNLEIDRIRGVILQGKNQLHPPDNGVGKAAMGQKSQQKDS